MQMTQKLCCDLRQQTEIKSLFMIPSLALEVLYQLMINSCSWLNNRLRDSPYHSRKTFVWSSQQSQQLASKNSARTRRGRRGTYRRGCRVPGGSERLSCARGTADRADPNSCQWDSTPSKHPTGKKKKKKSEIDSCSQINHIIWQSVVASGSSLRVN